MEERITLKELHAAALALARNKALGKDGVLVEFYITMWDYVGSILLTLLEEGIEKGILAPQFTEGVLILLAKQGDQ